MVARLLDTGGIERDVSKFARHLVAHGVQPHVACFNAGGTRWQEIKEAGIPLVIVPVKSLRSKSAIEGARILHQYILQNGIQLIHPFDIGSDLFCVPLGRIFRTPVLASQLCHRELYPKHIRWLMPILDRLATGVFVNCKSLADHLNKDYRLARKRIHICYNGYEPEEFNTEGRERPAELANASFVIGTVALLRPEKNLTMLIESFSRVYRIDNRARLLIVGSGPEKPKLVQKAEELALCHACLFKDTVSHPANWMRAIDVFVLPSRSEGFSNSLLEAMACGCCPVASNVGGAAELLNHGDCGILFESDNLDQLSNCLIHLIQEPERQRRIAKSAAAFVSERFTIGQATARLADIYRKLLS